MNNIESKANKSLHIDNRDKIKLYGAVFCIVLGVIGFNSTTLNNLFIQSTFFVTLSACSAALIFYSAYGRQLQTFFKEAKIELRRVVWPTISETKQMTLAVIIIITISIVFLMMVDGLLRYLLQLFIGLR